MVNQPDIDYSRYYKIWHSDNPAHIADMIVFYKRILGVFLPQNKESKILDVGCGMGFTMLALQEMGYKQIHGIEVSKEQVESCLSKKLNVVLACDTTAYLQNLHEEFDLILALDLIEHISVSEQLNLVRMVYQALKTKGCLICTVPNANSSLAARWRYNDWTHETSFTEHSLDFLLYNAGFRDISIHPTEFMQPPGRRFRPSKAMLLWWLFWFFRFFRRMEMVAELGIEQGKRVPLSLNILAKATKI